MRTETVAAFTDTIKRLNTLHSVQAVLEWDQETYMPERGAEDRGQQLAVLAGMVHDAQTDPRLGELLSELEADGAADDFVLTTNVRETRRTYERAVKLPKRLVEELARVSVLAKQAWAKARRENRFGDFAPHFERTLTLKREVADALGWESERYDALMDEFEPGARAAEVQAVFAALRAELVPLVAALTSAPRRPDPEVRKRLAPVEGQAEFSRAVAASLGYDFAAGRIDTTTHPFCSGFSPRDVRITTRYDARYLPMSLFGTMHEVGHGLYEQGFLAEHTFTPMAQSVSLGIHESQSRMWENQVGRSAAFWEHWYPKLQGQFSAFADVPRDAWVGAINLVEPSLIRVEADEVTYGLHIMLRFDLERRLLRDELAVGDVPEAWNAGMRELLGIMPPTDTEGCLQDIHWSMGIVGYFPTYALGNLYAAQFFAKAQEDIPDLTERIARNEHGTLLEWLRENIHRHGMRFRAGELVERVTGKALSAAPFVTYLKDKYEPLYGLR